MFIPGFLISLATFPGVIVHELAHVAFCKFTDTRVVKVCLFRLGNPAGYVIHEQPSTVWRHILIGVGPFFVNTFLGFVLGIIAIPLHMDWNHPTLSQLLLLWLGVSIAMHSFPSTGDAKSIWHAVWSQGAPISARWIGSPLVIVIFAGAIGSIFWLDALYGMGVIGAANALQKASQRDYAAMPPSNVRSSTTQVGPAPTPGVPLENTPAATPYPRSPIAVAPTAKAPETAAELFEELRQAGGLQPLAEFVCYPSPGHDQDSTFVLVAFSNHFASTLRALSKPVPEEFLEAEKADEKDRILLQWVFKDGVQLQKDPEILEAVVGSGGHMWSVDMKSPKSSKRFTLRMVFSESGRYRRDVLVDDTVVKSVPGRFEPIR